MKKLVYVAFSFVFAIAVTSCGSEKATEEKAAAVVENEAAAEEELLEMTEEEESTELAEHVCTAKCEEAGECVLACGEKGHTCSDACHAAAEEEVEAEAEGHDHESHEGHSH